MTTNPVTQIRKNIFGVTQTEFAKIAGVGQATVSRWENGETHPTLAEINAIRQEAAKRCLDWSDDLLFAANVEPQRVDASIYRLIADHTAAVARLEEICRKDEPRPNESDEFHLACKAADRALYDLIDVAPTSTVELHRKAGYLLLHMRHTEALERDGVEALLLSLLKLRLRPA